MSVFMRWQRGVLLLLAVLLTTDTARAKTPGKTYCFLGVCHRVKTLEETRRLVGRPETVIASHYNDARFDRFNPSNLTSSGAYFHAGRPDNAASPIYPNGTVLLVWNPPARKAVVVRVNNAGPYHTNRKLDLSRAAAVKLGFARQGVARLVVKVIHAPTTAEARYKRGRTYAPVAGYLGTFASLDQAVRVAGFGTGKGGVQPSGSIRVAAADGGRPQIAPPVRKPGVLTVLARLKESERLRGRAAGQGIAAVGWMDVAARTGPTSILRHEPNASRSTLLSDLSTVHRLEGRPSGMGQTQRLGGASAQIVLAATGLLAIPTSRMRHGPAGSRPPALHATYAGEGEVVARSSAVSAAPASVSTSAASLSE